MKIRHAAATVKRTEDNYVCISPDVIEEALENYPRRVDYNKFEKRFKGYWLVRWLCTDTGVNTSRPNNC